MERFAKIVETKTHQVLAYVEYDGDADETVLNQICQLDGVTANVASRFSGEKQVERAHAMLDAFDEEAAEQMIRRLSRLLEIDDA